MKKLTEIIFLMLIICTLAGCVYGTNDNTAHDPAETDREATIEIVGTDEAVVPTVESSGIGTMSPNVSAVDLTGPWHLDAYRNDLSDFSGLFEAYAEFGASMEIRSNGQLSWYIGAEGGTGTFSVDGAMLTAELTRTADESPMTTQFDILRDGDEVYLGMHWMNGIVFWTWGDDDSADLSGEDTPLFHGENVVELVNLRGDETTVYKLEDGRYMDRAGIVYIYDGADTWTDENGAEWNEIVR